MSKSIDVRIVSVSEPAEANAAAVFVHGIAGHFLNSWGPEGLPGTFLKRLSFDLPHVAVFTADYPSDMDRVIDDDALTLQRLVDCWADKLGYSLMNRFTSVAVIGYCLGGLLTTMAIRQWFHRDTRWSQRLFSHEDRMMLLLLDVLHQVPTKEDQKDGLVGLRSALQCNELAFQKNVDFWKKLVGSSHVGEGLPIEVHALLSQGDSFVRSWSPHAHLPKNRVHQTDVSHENLTRPPLSGAFFTYDFVVDRIREFGC